VVKADLVREIECHDEAQLQEVEEFVAFLKFRSRYQFPAPLDREKVAQLYGEFAEEDRALAEAGMAEYARDLAREDGK
jgi:hypothetical protein